MHRLINNGLRGEKPALKLVLSLLDRYGESRETKINLGELLKEDSAILAKAMRDGLLPDFGRNESPGPDREKGSRDADWAGDHQDAPLACSVKRGPAEAWKFAREHSGARSVWTSFDVVGLAHQVFGALSQTRPQYRGR